MFRYLVARIRDLFGCHHQFGVGVFVDSSQRKYEVCTRCGKKFWL